MGFFTAAAAAKAKAKKREREAEERAKQERESKVLREMEQNTAGADFSEAEMENLSVSERKAIREVEQRKRLRSEETARKQAGANFTDEELRQIRKAEKQAKERSELARKLGVKEDDLDAELRDIGAASAADINAAAFEQNRRQRDQMLKAAGITMRQSDDPLAATHPVSRLVLPGGSAIREGVNQAKAIEARAPELFNYELSEDKPWPKRFAPPGGSAYKQGIEDGLRASAKSIDAQISEGGGLADLETDDPEEQRLRKRREEIRALLGE